MREILHICERKAWEQAASGTSYEPPAMAEEGFIHCSTREQVLGPANALFRGQAGLVLLVIDRERVEPPVVDEDCYDSGQAFPHIYGPLNVDAVVRVVDFPPGADGLFLLPDNL